MCAESGSGGNAFRVEDAVRSCWVLRPYRQGDLSRLHEIDQVCFPRDVAYSRSELRFYLHHPASVSHVADSSGGILGFVVGMIRRDRTGHVITLDVVPEARRKGIGTALISKLHWELVRREITRVVLEVGVDNVVARLFYERLGYQYEGIIPGYYGGKTDACRMIRCLQSAGDRA